MDPKAFNDLMKARHSVRVFQKKEIPEETLKEIIRTALQTPSWCNNQPWNIYVASGKTLTEIRNIWESKGKEGIKGYSDLPPGHRTDYSERSQKTMEIFFKDVGALFQDPKFKPFVDTANHLYYAPTLVYLTISKKINQYSILDLGALEMSIVLSAKSYGVDSLIAYESIKYADVIRKYCKVPDDESIIIGIALGYEDEEIKSDFRSKKTLC